MSAVAVQTFGDDAEDGLEALSPAPSGKDSTVVVELVCFVEIDASLFVDLAQQCHQVLSI